MKRIILAAALACATTGVSAEENLYSANFWVKMCSADMGSAEMTACLSYLSGMADTQMLLHRVFCPPKGVQNGQMREIVLKKLQAEPGLWRLPMVFLATEAMAEAFPCPADDMTGSAK